MNVRTALRKRKNEVRGKKGFTLVELVIVIAVLAIIAFIAIPAVSNVIGNANVTADNSNAQSIELTIKTAQSEVAANNTNESKKANDLIAKTGNEASLGFLLTTYGVDTDKIGLGSGDSNADALKSGSGFHYFYVVSTGKVYVATGAKDTKDIQLNKASTLYTIKDNELTLTATHS